MALKIKLFCPTLDKTDLISKELLFYIPTNCEFCGRPIGDLDYQCNLRVISIKPVRVKLSDEECLQIIEELLKGGKANGEDAINL